MSESSLFSDSHPDPALAEIDAYLCGEMPAAQARAFESRVAADAALARALEAQRHAQLSLRRAFSPPAPPTLPATPPSPAAPATPVAPALAAGKLAWLTKQWAIAIALALVATTAITITTVSRRGGGGAAAPIDPLTAFAAASSDGFKPSIPLSDPNELSLALSTKLARRVEAHDGNGVHFLGLRTGVGGTPMAIGVLATVGDSRVLLIADLADRSAPDHPAASVECRPPMHRHERVAKGLKLTEISTSPAPLLLDHFSVD
ncbi:MAG: hypothetical protein JSR77_12290 [Planctomycetes bacterium]|nr:hypothetical protein [Planctomycetota bacterium]